MLIPRRRCRAFSLLALLTVLPQAGCLLTHAKHAVPVDEIPYALEERTRSGQVALDLTLLEQKRPATHIVGPGDTLTIYIQGILPPTDDAVAHTMQRPQAVSSTYYPPNGLAKGPAFGVPMEVDADGSITLPLVGRFTCTGMTTPSVKERIRDVYVKSGIIKSGRDRIVVTLAKARVHRVHVIREDGEIPQLLNKNSSTYAKRGSSQLVDLPAYQNDVLHALTASGGLPGQDAENEVWVLRGNCSCLQEVRTQLETGITHCELIDNAEARGDVVRIPLRVDPGAPLPFGPEDIILNDGDIVFLPPRNEFFYTAGLLPGGRIPLPRDQDIDVLEAIAIAGGSVGGTGGSSSRLFQSGGLGNIIPPSLVVIVRRLPDGSQIPIRIDLGKAMINSEERVVIRPDDVVYLHYTAGELTSNALLNLFHLNFLINSDSI